MRELPDGLAEHLDGGVTTLAWCWRVERTDGVALGFTDHDRDLAFADTVFLAESGMTASDMDQSVGLSVDSSDVVSRISDDALTERDLAAGLYDGARVSIFRVNWVDVSQHVLLRVGVIGEVTRGAHQFKAELRGLSHALQQERGRLYQYQCDADLGDGRCGIDLTLAEHRATGVVSAVLSASRFEATGLSSFSSADLTGGKLVWSHGLNSLQAIEVHAHSIVGDSVVLELWQTPSEPIEVGDTFVVTAGCDKRIETCRDRFANAVNFRGFPFIPGNDRLAQAARRNG